MFAMKPPAEVTDSSAWARQRLTRVVDAFRRGDIDSERKLICALTDQWKHLDRTGALNELVIDSAADTDFASLIGLGAIVGFCAGAYVIVSHVWRMESDG